MSEQVIKSAKPRKLGVRQKENRVMQAAGYRMALLELLPDVKDSALRETIMQRGHWADTQVLENGGIMFVSFERAVERMEAANGKADS